METKQYICEEDFATEYEDVYGESLSAEESKNEPAIKDYIVYWENAECNEYVEQVILDEKNKLVILHFGKEMSATHIIELALKNNIEMSWEYDHYTLTVPVGKIQYIKPRKK